MKKFIIILAVLLVAAAPVLALQPHGANYDQARHAAYKTLKCSTTANLNQAFALKTVCPREASINGEDISVELLDTQSKPDGVYAHFKVYTNGKTYEFWRVPSSFMPAVAGQYNVYTVSAAVIRVSGTAVWGTAEFKVVKI